MADQSRQRDEHDADQTDQHHGRDSGEGAARPAFRTTIR
jgi:hypothetical protein